MVDLSTEHVVLSQSLEKIDKMTEYTDYQRKAVNALSLLGVSLTTVNVKKGKLFLKPSLTIGKVIYLVLQVNFLIKSIFLILCINQVFLPVVFLDKISALMWLMMTCEMVQEYRIWMTKYPFFEVLKALWTLENNIFRKLGRPGELKDTVYHKIKCIVTLHSCFVLFGCASLVFQFWASPKYPLYTYSIFEADNVYLRALFAAHEWTFMFLAWNLYASIVCISSMNAVELTHTLEAMTEVMNSFSRKKKSAHPRTGSRENCGKLDNVAEKDDETNAFTKCATKIIDRNNEIANKIAMALNPLYRVPGTEYDIHDLLFDYRQLMLIVEQLNAWCAYRCMGVHFFGYCEFISAVFCAIQLLRLPDTDFLAVFFFMEDCCVCMYMMFRMFNTMSKLYPTSQTFIQAFQFYLCHENPSRQKLLKILPSLNVVSLHLGPNPVKPETVGNAMMILMNYYVCVAMW